MIVLGRIVAPFGVQGWLKIHPFGDDPESWRKMPQWWLSADDNAPPEQWKPYTLKACRTHGKGLVAAFGEVPDRNAAEAVDGWYIGAPREALPTTAENEFYWGDLVGLDVVNESGESLGSVKGLLSTGAHDVLQVGEGETERLIPFVAAFVLDVDLAARRIRVAWGKDW
ncbi:16S rRNA processing protein RimM [Thauera propionica]|uniref:Ribosome maturation factor RimM n=1 Tax=Thauera propionica TaxID=2019431 RepID=A0A235EXZ9_9RHOO|nr:MULTISPECIES: ribosome maturation factor RimM [Thauera]MDD3677542.1 ribosome maturation factor RimM [Thauera propionica]OYD53909.1 16S rRNA processing protein RimM [Thauera propionica]